MVLPDILCLFPVQDDFVAFMPDCWIFSVRYGSMLLSSCKGGIGMPRWLKVLLFVLGLIVLAALLFTAARVAWMFWTGTLSYSDGFFYYAY